MQQFEPAHSIIELIGGVPATAQAAGITETSVRRWRMRTESGGTGGYIPRKWHAKLIEHAGRRGIALPPSAFLNLALVPKIRTEAA